MLKQAKDELGKCAAQRREEKEEKSFKFDYVKREPLSSRETTPSSLTCKQKTRARVAREKLKLILVDYMTNVFRVSPTFQVLFGYEACDVS